MDALDRAGPPHVPGGRSDRGLGQAVRILQGQREPRLRLGARDLDGGGRKRTRQQDTTRDWQVVGDWVDESITLRRGLTGAKPRAFCMWVMDLLNVEPGDTVDDLFPGSGAVGAAIAERLRHEIEPLELFG